MGIPYTNTADQDPLVSLFPIFNFLSFSGPLWLDGCVQLREQHNQLQRTVIANGAIPKDSQRILMKTRKLSTAKSNCSLVLPAPPPAAKNLSQLRTKKQGGKSILHSVAFHSSHFPGAFRQLTRHMLIARAPRDPERHRVWQQQIWANRLWNSHFEKKEKKSLFPSAKLSEHSCIQA